MTVTAPPADGDRVATLIARHLVENFEAVGIDTTLDILPEMELYRQVFLNRDFELFVAQMPPMDDPHVLDSLVRSVFATEPGWQNPYGFTDLSVDDFLDAQRVRIGSARRETVDALLQRLSRDQPFATIGFPDQIRAIRTDRFTGWERYGVREPISYLALDRGADVSPTEDLTLRLSITDKRFSENLNPLAIEYRQPKPFTSLLYDPLVRHIRDEVVPWLASGWEWEPKQEAESGGTLVVSLRPESRWHDDTELTADDVVFTFTFLQDTALGSLSQAVPAPRFRSLSSLVEDVHPLDNDTVRITVDEASEAVATRLLTVPIFPEHIWRDKNTVADIQGIEGSQNVTEALVWPNKKPVGSGPLSVSGVSPDESVTLQLFDEHFLWSRGASLEAIPEAFTGLPAFEKLRLVVVPSNETAVELVAQGELDGTATRLDSRPPVLERLANEPSLSTLVEQSDSPYHVGYNTSIFPFSNLHFRRLLSRLLDKQYIAESIFDGYGRPAATPFDRTQWSSPERDFDTVDPEVPFLGTDGDVDVEAARDAFREYGFAFDENDRLVLR